MQFYVLPKFVLQKKRLPLASNNSIKQEEMKKILFLATLLILGVSMSYAEGTAEITFEKKTHDFGKFSEKNPEVTCEFKFTNTGDAPLVIHQAVASCGCTVPEYTQEPVMPGKSGTIKVTYNGKGRYPGHFKKAITIRSNAKTATVRIFIQGDMEAKDAKEKKQ